MQPRTKRQKEVLDYITQFVDRNGYEPSYQQIARQLGVRSKSGIQRHVASLEGLGLLSRRRENGSFGIEVLASKTESDAVGNIELVETDREFREMARSTIAVPKFIFGPFALHELFAFRTVDDSLLEEHICENDIIILEKRNYARRGQISVVAACGQTRLGRFRNLGTEVEISPANPDFEPVIFPADEAKLLGVMRGLFRPVPTHGD